MSVGIIGAGRMGRVLAGILAQHHTLYLFDRDETKLRQVAGETGAVAAESLEDIVRQQRVILAVPDREVISCIKALNEQKQPVQVIQQLQNHPHPNHSSKPEFYVPTKAGAKYTNHACRSSSSYNSF